MKNYCPKLVKTMFYKKRRKFYNGIREFISWYDKWPYLLGFKRAPENSMPNFIIAGLPKCGTYWLVDALKKDPKFKFVSNPYLEEKGEFRFFSIHFSKPIQTYFDAFLPYPSYLTFEKSPDYSIMGRLKLKLLLKLNPDIKIILLFRDPVQRLFSSAKMELIRKRGLVIESNTDHLFFNHYKTESKKYDYQAIIGNWKEVFKPEQLLFLSLEQISSSPEEVLNKVYDFLNVPYLSLNETLTEAKNRTADISFPEHHKAYIENVVGDIKFSENFY